MVRVLGTFPSRVLIHGIERDNIEARRPLSSAVVCVLDEDVSRILDKLEH